jgi:uncharacterized membrane protein
VTLLTVTEYPCHIWPRISSVCHNENPFLSSFMTYHREYHDRCHTSSSNCLPLSFFFWSLLSVFSRLTSSDYPVASNFLCKFVILFVHYTIPLWKSVLIILLASVKVVRCLVETGHSYGFANFGVKHQTINQSIKQTKVGYINRVIHWLLEGVCWPISILLSTWSSDN